jgi:hypothetical protein
MLIYVIASVRREAISSNRDSVYAIGNCFPPGRFAVGRGADAPLPRNDMQVRRFLSFYRLGHYEYEAFHHELQLSNLVSDSTRTKPPIPNLLRTGTYHVLIREFVALFVDGLYLSSFFQL